MSDSIDVIYRQHTADGNPIESNAMRYLDVVLSGMYSEEQITYAMSFFVPANINHVSRKCMGKYAKVFATVLSADIKNLYLINKNLLRIMVKNIKACQILIGIDGFSTFALTMDTKTAHTLDKKIMRSLFAHDSMPSIDYEDLSAFVSANKFDKWFMFPYIRALVYYYRQNKNEIRKKMHPKMTFFWVNFFESNMECFTNLSYAIMPYSEAPAVRPRIKARVQVPPSAPLLSPIPYFSPTNAPYRPYFDHPRGMAIIRNARGEDVHTCSIPTYTAVIESFINQVNAKARDHTTSFSFIPDDDDDVSTSGLSSDDSDDHLYPYFC